MRLFITRSDFLGFLFLALGVGIFVGHWVSEHTLNLDHVMSGIGFASMLIGAALLSPDTVTKTLQSLVETIKDILPWGKKNGV